ncbi:hypothetical protein L5515_019389 [Caenorhabditis briggsae]|uniref:Arrestin C-terminal-like domain-containing protein n=1 Tax=Caenorhabditis briggsae TaxID=6238 RepID=A0AAE9FE56_CAEBR|nr:hypothetical protein L5515_019389 [Caenorhabditis briggsae]
MCEHVLWRNIVNYFKYTCSGCATIFNIVLISLVIFRSPKSLGAYKYLMIYISAFDIFYSVWDVVWKPVVYSYGSAFTVFRHCKDSFFSRELSFYMVVAYCACFTFSLACFGVHFVYRYGSLNNEFREKYINGKKMCVLFIVPIVYGCWWFAISATMFHFDDFTDEYLNIGFHEDFYYDTKEAAIMVILFYWPSNDGKLHPNWKTLTAMANVWFMSVKSTRNNDFIEFTSSPSNVEHKPDDDINYNLLNYLSHILWRTKLFLFHSTRVTSDFIMNTFTIVFDQPEFTTGQNVTGRAVFQTSVAINACYLKICIHGAAHTKWNESEQRHRDCNGTSECYTETVQYASEINYVSGETIAWSAKNGTNTLQPGNHIFPFSFPLPVDCPPSYEGFHGHIRYSIRVELDRPWNFNKKEREYFKVVPNFDLNYLPYGNTPIMQKDVKDIGAIFKKGIVTMTVTIPKQAVASGEALPITIDIDNCSKRPAYCVRAELKQNSHYNASRNSLFSHSSCHDHHKDDSKRVAETRKNIKITARTHGREQLMMKIPKLAPSFQCPIIGVEYCLSVKLDTETSLNNTLHCEFNLIIGTVPIIHNAIPIAVSSVAPTAPPGDRTESMPPPYFSLTPTAQSNDSAGPSAPPPTYDEAMAVTKI